MDDDTNMSPTRAELRRLRDGRRILDLMEALKASLAKDQPQPTDAARANEKEAHE